MGSCDTIEWDMGQGARDTGHGRRDKKGKGDKEVIVMRCINFVLIWCSLVIISQFIMVSYVYNETNFIVMELKYIKEEVALHNIDQQVPLWWVK
jgi:hypothetical protein